MSETKGETPNLDDAKEHEPGGLIDRFGDLIVDYVSSPTRRNELLWAGIQIGAETVYDVRKVGIEGNQYGNSYIGVHPDNVGPLPTNQSVRGAMDALGDIWEISWGQTVVRAGIYALEKKLGKTLLSDDAAFWVSLALPVTFKALHTLGLISIFGIHDHVGDPKPIMLIGQAVASAALIRAHYAARRQELEHDATNLGGDQSRISNAVESLAIESSAPENN